jgi:hypothetical protein
LIIVQAGGVAIKTLGIAGAVLAVLAGEAGDEAQAVRKIRSQKLALRTVKVEEESLRICIRFIIALEQWNALTY